MEHSLVVSYKNVYLIIFTKMIENIDIHLMAYVGMFTAL